MPLHGIRCHVCLGFFSPWNYTEENPERLFLRFIRHVLIQTKYVQEIKYEKTDLKRKVFHLRRQYCCQKDNSKNMSQEGRRNSSRKKLASLFLLSFPSIFLSSILPLKVPQSVVPRPARGSPPAPSALQHARAQMSSCCSPCEPQVGLQPPG